MRPFKGSVKSAVPGSHTITDFYATAANVLLLQQFGIAFGALSFVRERRLGIQGVFKVSPVSALQAVVGKYLADLLLGGVVAAALTAMVVGLLGVPMQGAVGWTVPVLGLVLLASVGVGFGISLLPSTYGIKMLRQVMLLDRPPTTNTAIALGLFAAVVLVGVTLGARRRFRATTA